MSEVRVLLPSIIDLSPMLSGCMDLMPGFPDNARPPGLANLYNTLTRISVDSLTFSHISIAVVVAVSVTTVTYHTACTPKHQSTKAHIRTLYLISLLNYSVRSI